MNSLCLVLGLALVSGYAFGTSHTTDGDSGELCGILPHMKKCLDGEATCVDDECVCDPTRFDYGDGTRNCYKNNTFRTEVFNDPTVLTYNNNEVGLPIPCRYLWTHTKTYLKNRKRERVGYCYMEAYAFHNKDRGKVYVAGYDVAIRIHYDNGTMVEMSIRKYGKATDGEYNYVVNGTFGSYLPNGDWQDDVIDFHDPSTNLGIKCEFDEDNNLALLKAKKCGIDIQFRAYDCVQRIDQEQVPHLAYGVNCAFHPSFLSQDKVVAISPVEHGGVTIDDLVPTGLSDEQYMIYRALNSMAVQNSPYYPNPQCDTARDSLNNCDETELVTAMNKCHFLLEYPRFINCLDPSISGEGIMELYSKCVDIYCDTGVCSDFKDLITGAGCYPYSGGTQPGVDDFMDNPC